MRDEQHRPRERVEGRLERLAALEVEVVGRLVEDEEVRARGDGDGEREPPPLAAREHGDLLLVCVPAGEEKAAEEALRVGASEPCHRLHALEDRAARVELQLLL